MNTYNYRINLFNNNYIIIYTSAIISKHNEYKHNYTDKNAIIWHTLYNNLKEANIIAANSPIAIEKNTIEAQIIMSELTEEEKRITIEDVKNACVIAAYEGNSFANHLSYIILTNPKANNFGSDKEFAKQYGQNVTNYILHNNSTQEYQNQMNGKLPYEYDRHVFLYEDGIIKKTELPEPTLNKVKTRRIK